VRSACLTLYHQQPSSPRNHPPPAKQINEFSISSSAEFAEVFTALTAEIAEAEFLFFLFGPSVIERLYKAWQMGDQQQFEKILVNPFNFSIPLFGMEPHIAKIIADQLFPKQLQDAVASSYSQVSDQKLTNLGLSEPGCKQYDDSAPLHGGGTYEIKCPYETKGAFRNLPFIAVLQAIMSQIASFQPTPAIRLLDENDLNTMLPLYGMAFTGRDQIIPNTHRQVQLFTVNRPNQPNQPNQQRSLYFTNQILINTMDPNPDTEDLQRSIQYWLNLVKQSRPAYSNFCITLNVNNAHWVALCLRYTDNQVHWQLADSNAINDPAGATAIANAVQQVMHRLSNSNSNVFFTEQQFVISPNNYQPHGSYNCGLFALAYTEGMLAGNNQSNLTEQQLETLRTQGAMLRQNHNSYDTKTLRLMVKNKIKAGDVLVLSPKKKHGYDAWLISSNNQIIGVERYSGDFEYIQIEDKFDLKALTSSDKQGVFSNNIYYVDDKNNSLSADNIKHILAQITSSLETQRPPNDPLIKVLNNAIKLNPTNRLGGLGFLVMLATQVTDHKLYYSSTSGSDDPDSIYTEFRFNPNYKGAYICGRRFDFDESTESERKATITAIYNKLCLEGSIRLDIINRQEITECLSKLSIESLYTDIADGRIDYRYENSTLEAVIYTIYAAYYGQRWTLTCGEGLGRTTAMLLFGLMILSADYQQGYKLAKKYVNYQKGIRERRLQTTLKEFLQALNEFDQYLRLIDPSQTVWKVWSLWSRTVSPIDMQNLEQLKNLGFVADGKLTVKGRLSLLQAVLADLRMRSNQDLAGLADRDKYAFFKYLLPFMTQPNAKM